MDFQEKVLEFIKTEVAPRGADMGIGVEDSLLDAGLIDSVGLMQLLGYVEEQTGLKVPDHEVNPDNFETVSRISALVDRLRAR